ncbi:hypothetical protein AALP_AA3G076100 [Arabis alpina]|uniref:Patellin-1-6 C-terminal GOLD domain-containing protein n=1 Tax=Arabis alpina TaxID=50452 RepID=A0A087H7Q2_ARAAL|nr:hypothetical protein AALP_AA3G076100 [Arabis alpina]
MGSEDESEEIQAVDAALPPPTVPDQPARQPPTEPHQPLQLELSYKKRRKLETLRDQVRGGSFENWSSLVTDATETSSSCFLALRFRYLHLRRVWLQVLAAAACDMQMNRTKVNLNGRFGESRWREMLELTLFCSNSFDPIISARGELESAGGSEKPLFMHGHDRKGHPVCYYRVYSEFTKDLLADAAKRNSFKKDFWKILFMEKMVRNLDFRSLEAKQAGQLLLDNYPEFVYRYVCIDNSWHSRFTFTLTSQFKSKRSKHNIISVAPSSFVAALCIFIAPNQIPLAFGGFSEDPGDISPKDKSAYVNVQAKQQHIVEFPCNEKREIVLKMRVFAHPLMCKADFVPKGDAIEVVLLPEVEIQENGGVKSHKFIVDEPGTVLLTVVNSTKNKNALLVYTCSDNPV